MEGRRVSRQNQRYNPLFILFLCLVTAVAILLIVSLVLGARLSKVSNQLNEAEKTITELNANIDQLESDLSASLARTTGPIGSSSEPSGEAVENAPSESGITIDFSAHSEVSVQPQELLGAYETNYTTAAVNLRAGPGTSYKRITSLNYGTQVDVAARENGWSFVRTGSNFGWVSSDYLATSKPGGR